MLKSSSYIKIKDILNQSAYKDLNSINLYGVITFISSPTITKQNPKRKSIACFIPNKNI